MSGLHSLTADTCVRILVAIEMMSRKLTDKIFDTPVVKSAENIAVYVHRLNVDEFNGITCTVGRHRTNDDISPASDTKSSGFRCASTSELCQHTLDQQHQQQRHLTVSELMPRPNAAVC
jgi:hypothetical protein